ncbi:MAG: hypothetical protein WA952_17920 [Lewinella sp.]
MGYGKWSSTEYGRYRSSYSSRSREDIFTANRHRRMDPRMDPFRVNMRESRDSPEHPNSLAVSLYLDVTGSMGMVPEDLVRNQLGGLMDTMLAQGVTSPQLMFSAIGDHRCDRAPLQLGQFESSTQLINDGLGRLFLEGGGGDAPESYLLAWHAAARHTSLDCWEKRREKGFLFTVGDDTTHATFEAAAQTKIFGYDSARTVSAADLLTEAQERYHVFHIHIDHGRGGQNARVADSWYDLLGKRSVSLRDYHQLGMLVATIVSVMGGAEADDIVGRQDEHTRKEIAAAIKNIHI